MTQNDWDTTNGGAARQPGWHPDPWYRGQHRLWTGSGWTADVFPDGPGTPTAPIAETAARYGPPPTEHAPTPPPPPWWYGPQWLDAAPPTSSETLESPPRRSAPRWLMATLAAGTGLVIGFTAVYFATDHHAGTAAAAGGAQTTPPPPVTSAPQADPAAAVLNQLVVHPADVPPAVNVFVIPGGDQVAGQATLDLCNGTYPSEALRTARLQVAASTASGDTLLSTEAVLYRSPAAAAQALSELRSVTARCPDRPVTSPVGEPTTTTTFGPAPDTGWPNTPGVQRQAYDVTSTDQSGQSDHSVAIYLRRGRVLLALYVPRNAGRAGADVDGKTSLPDITTTFATRLERLPASAVQ